MSGLGFVLSHPFAKGAKGWGTGTIVLRRKAAFRFVLPILNAKTALRMGHGQVVGNQELQALSGQFPALL
jgi:hypothetical protein